MVTTKMQVSEAIIRNNYFNYLENAINSYKTAEENKEEYQNGEMEENE